MELSNHIQIPQIGLGVYKMEAGDEMNNAIGAAWNAGYRLFDTAQMYGNEAALGEALQVNHIPRESIFLVSKVNNCNQWYEPALASLRSSLERLQTSYLDAFLIHWPGQDQNRMLSTWRALEQAYRDGLVKSIGVCNFEICHLEFLLSNSSIAPIIDQVEHSPQLHDPRLTAFCQAHGIQVMAWAPLRRGDFGEEVQRIAEKYHKTAAQVVLRWNLQRGIIPLPKSVRKERMQQNLDVFDFILTDSDMEAIGKLEHGETLFASNADPEYVKLIHSINIH